MGWSSSPSQTFDLLTEDFWTGTKGTAVTATLPISSQKKGLGVVWKPGKNNTTRQDFFILPCSACLHLWVCPRAIRLCRIEQANMASVNAIIFILTNVDLKHSLRFLWIFSILLGVFLWLGLINGQWRTAQTLQSLCPEVIVPWLSVAHGFGFL